MEQARKEQGRNGTRKELIILILPCAKNGTRKKLLILILPCAKNGTRKELIILILPCAKNGTRKELLFNSSLRQNWNKKEACWRHQHLWRNKEGPGPTTKPSLRQNNMF